MARDWRARALPGAKALDVVRAPVLSAVAAPGQRDGMTRDVTLRELIEAMSQSEDDEVFRWFQISYVDSSGVPAPGDTLRLTIGQVRREMGT